jgi:hypothetical protein
MIAEPVEVLAYSALKSVVYPIERCVHFNTDPDAYKAWLCTDKAYLHSVLLAASAMRDYMARRPFSIDTLFHLRRAITHLNHQLTEKDAFRSDPVLWCVITLASLSAMFLDHAAGLAHLSGLRRIVDLRGGQVFLRSNPKKSFKLSW